MEADTPVWGPAIQRLPAWSPGRGRMGDRIPPRCLAAAQATRHHHQPRPARPPQKTAVRPRHPALAASTRQTVGAHAADLRVERRLGQRGSRRAHPLQRVPDPVGVDRLAYVDRPLLERHLAWVTDFAGGHGVKKNCVSGISSSLQAIRQHGWDDTLPNTAVLLPGDCQPPPDQVSRQLAEHVMAQIESPANLDRWPDSACRLVTLILMHAGLRISSARTPGLRLPAPRRQGAPYLRYYNTKMRREAAVSIDEELEADIRTQQRRVLHRWPNGKPLPIPQTPHQPHDQDPLGRQHLPPPALPLAAVLRRPRRAQSARASDPHQWRHIFACCLKMSRVGSDA